MSSCAIWSLWNLYTVLIFHAHRFFNISSSLAIIEHALTDDGGLPITPTVDFCSVMRTNLDPMREYCLAMGLTFSVQQIDRIKAILEQTDLHLVKRANLAVQIQSLSVRIQDELQASLFLSIPKEREDFYRDPRHQFGKPTLDKFPSIVTDVESAGRCYATGNATATVFHLMRVMECGLRVLGKSLGDPSLEPTRNPTWESMLRKCDEELKRPLKERTDEWRRADQFYSESTANLRAVKDAWRNPTMHVEQVYDDDQAFTVFNTVKSFMRHLSTRLAE